MIGVPGSSGVPSLRRPTAAQAELVQAVWEASYAQDDPGSRPRGGWSVDSWATGQCALLVDEGVVGVAAVRAEPLSSSFVDARLALALDRRQPALAEMLVKASLDLAREADGEKVRLFVPSGADWALEAARKAGFEPVRSIFHMLLPGAAALAELNIPHNVRIRAMHPGEEPAILDALNNNWEGTWNFTPIRLEMLEGDLVDQRDGMLLAVDARDDARIVATCHAVFDATDRNPDGDPRAWISNLTVHPEYRGQGLGRTMLVAGLRFLRDRGAGSITLGVDAGDPAPLRLYESVGFVTISSIEAWDKSLLT
jgi:mycothiol synthase